jgi:uncharacterized protein YkwD
MTFPRPGRRVSGVLSAALVAVFAVAVLPLPVSASTASDAEAMVVDLINAERVERGLVPLRRYHDLADVAGRRAARMRDTNTLSHSVAGNLGTQLTNEGVRWWRYGETIGYSYKAWAKEAGRELVQMWMSSAPHRDLLMSKQLNYIGVGLAYRSGNGRTFGSVVMSESPDRNGARSWFTGSKVTGGDDLTWTWAGADLRLQTRTAGLRDFDVQVRVNGGSWTTVRNDTTATALTLWNRPSGRTYGMRVRATDRRGNVGAWTSEKTIRVP